MTVSESHHLLIEPYRQEANVVLFGLKKPPTLTLSYTACSWATTVSASSGAERCIHATHGTRRHMTSRRTNAPQRNPNLEVGLKPTRPRIDVFDTHIVPRSGSVWTKSWDTILKSKFAPSRSRCTLDRHATDKWSST